MRPVPGVHRQAVAARVGRARRLRGGWRGALGAFGDSGAARLPPTRAAVGCISSVTEDKVVGVRAVFGGVGGGKARVISVCCAAKRIRHGDLGRG
jgi:hypothetical protein